MTLYAKPLTPNYCQGCSKQLAITSFYLKYPGRYYRLRYCNSKCTAGLPTKYARQYNIWNGMNHRCSDEKNKSYERYGAKGIKVCDRWQSFEMFLKDMLPSYRPGLTLDRIDNNKGYSPDNCRWATHSEQRINQRRVRFFDWKGEHLNLYALQKKTGVDRRTILKRIDKLGWSLEKAITAKVYN